MKSNTRNIVLCALFSALTAILSQISIPLPFTPVPINLATLAVCLAGGILGAKWGTISQVVYVLLGAIGLPVFAGFTSGVGIIMGPTGGYIAGYIASAFIIGLVYDKIKKNNLWAGGAAMSIGILGCYTLGTVWFMYITKNGLREALLLCVIPFLIGDLIKIVSASLIISKVKKYTINL